MMNQLTFTIVSSIFISGVAAYLGTLMLSKKMSIIAGPLAHLSLPGAALAIIYGFNISLGVFPFVILGAILIWLLEKKTKLPIENLTAIIFAFGVGIALLILPISKAEEALIGSITTITLAETLAVIIISSAVFLLVNKIYQKIMLINIHEEVARADGINASHYNLYYLLSIAIVVSLGVYLVGGLITAALIAIPAASARNVSKNLYSYKLWAVVFGISAAIMGIFIARFYDVPAGPCIIVTAAVLFIFTVFIKRS